MNRLALTIIMMAVALMFSMNAHAQDDNLFHPSRVRLVIHGGYDLTDMVRLEERFVPAGNLLGVVAPLNYLGLKVRVTDWFMVEPYLGWNFGVDEPLISLSLNPRGKKVWAWAEIDFYPVGLNGYWFAEADYHTIEWLHVGVEGEGWGSYADSGSWSSGVGPNTLLRFKQVGLDLALHVRNLDGEVKPEFFFRVHLFL